MYQRVMDSLFTAEHNVDCCQDDILVTGLMDAEHLQNLDLVLKKISDMTSACIEKSANLWCHLSLNLDHTIDAEGLHRTDEKI